MDFAWRLRLVRSVAVLSSAYGAVTVDLRTRSRNKHEQARGTQEARRYKYKRYCRLHDGHGVNDYKIWSDIFCIDTNVNTACITSQIVCVDWYSSLVG